MPAVKEFIEQIVTKTTTCNGSAFFTLLACLIITFRANCQDTTLYNNNYSIACHNCFEKRYSTSLTDALAYTSTIEIDIWDTPLPFNKLDAMKNDWFVKHTFFQKGNKNCFGGSLVNCLTKVANWSNQNPNHNVLTVFLDKKQGWSGKKGARRPEDLDSLITSIFGRKKLFIPGDLANESTDLRTAVKKNNWVSLNTLKGKVVFIITDASLFKLRNIVLNKYLQKRKESAICFVAPTIKKEHEISDPKGISKINSSNIIFYNLNFKNVDLSTKISYNNYINRVFRSPETTKEVNKLTGKKVNFVALTNYKLNGKLETFEQ